MRFGGGQRPLRRPAERQAIMFEHHPGIGPDGDAEAAAFDAVAELYAKVKLLPMKAKLPAELPDRQFIRRPPRARSKRHRSRRMRLNAEHPRKARLGRPGGVADV